MEKTFPASRELTAWAQNNSNEAVQLTAARGGGGSIGQHSRQHCPSFSKGSRERKPLKKQLENKWERERALWVFLQRISSKCERNHGEKKEKKGREMQFKL